MSISVLAMLRISSLLDFDFFYFYNIVRVVKIQLS